VKMPLQRKRRAQLHLNLWYVKSKSTQSLRSDSSSRVDSTHDAVVYVSIAIYHPISSCLSLTFFLSRFPFDQVKLEEVEVKTGEEDEVSKAWIESSPVQCNECSDGILIS
jgi:hypothetical protein